MQYIKKLVTNKFPLQDDFYEKELTKYTNNDIIKSLIIGIKGRIC